MNDLELQLRLKSTLRNYVFSLMSQNNVSAAMMEDAMNSVLLALKDEIAIQLIAANSEPQKEESEDGDN